LTIDIKESIKKGGIRGACIPCGHSYLNAFRLCLYKPTYVYTKGVVGAVSVCYVWVVGVYEYI